MPERKAFPSPPNMNRIAEKDGTPTLPFAGWFGILASWMQRVRVISADADWPSLSAGASQDATMVVKGARVGDFAMASLDPSHADLAVTASVSADDEVTVWVTNLGGSPVDLAAGTLRVRVEKAR